MSKQYYIAEKDNDVSLPALTKEGKALVLPLFIVGVAITNHESKAKEHLQKVSFEFEVHESIKESKVQEIDIFHEDENGNYDYSKYKESVPSSSFIGKRVKGADLWRNLTKHSGKMNRILLSDLPSYGIEVETEEVEIDGQKFTSKVIPDLTPEMFLGKAVFGFLGIESYTSKRGNLVSLVKVKKVVSTNGKIEDQVVIGNSLDKDDVPVKSAATENANSQFSDIVDEDELPF